MTKLQQMKAELNILMNQSKELMNKDSVTAEELNNKAAEIENLKAKISMQEQIEAQEKADMEAEMKKGAGNLKNNLLDSEIENDYNKIFLNALAGKPLTATQKEILIKNSMSSSTGEDGGYLIPDDQRTEIIRLERDLKPLSELVNVEIVTTLKGSRNIEADAEFTPFQELTEGGTVQNTDTPTFVNIPFVIKDYSGILSVPNNLLNDTKALQKYLLDWLSKKSVATKNHLIVTILNTLAKTAVASLDDVKSILNVQLDPAVATNSYLVMNQDAFNKFDTMKDNTGKPLLQPMLTDPTKYVISGREVKVYSNKTLPTRNDSGTKKAPVIIGNLKRAITLFDRQAMSMLATNIGAGAFETNTTKFRPIFRMDLQKFDEKAVVFGEIVVD